MTTRDTSDYVRWDVDTSALLCKAYKLASVDPEAGTDQTHDQFWDKVVSTLFHNSYTQRNIPVHKLTSQFTKVSGAVAKFASHYAAVERTNPSGNNGEKDFTTNALSLYRADHPSSSGSVFKFFKAYEVLKGCVKWRRAYIPEEMKKYLEEKEREKQEAKAKKALEALPSLLALPRLAEEGANPDARPIGRKAAKRQRTVNAESEGISTLLEELKELMREANAKEQLMIDELETYNNQQALMLQYKKQKKIDLLREARTEEANSSNGRIDLDSK